jgi:hypothetical protein
MDFALVRRLDVAEDLSQPFADRHVAAIRFAEQRDMATVAVSALAVEEEFQRPALFPWVARRGMLGQETENPSKQ